jgi:hypothetical protein
MVSVLGAIFGFVTLFTTVATGQAGAAGLGSHHGSHTVGVRADTCPADTHWYVTVAACVAGSQV